jgi:eukaryotic-like serine/threonine-protein kinase
MTISTPSIQQTVFGDHNIVVGAGHVNIVKPAPLTDRERDDRLGLATLLQRVKASWIDGVLKQSLQDGVLIQPGLETRSWLLDESRLLPHENGSEVNQVVPPGKSLLELLDESGGMLLILGGPGSGKTITLLQLAQELLARAEEDQKFSSPVPVVFNLSSWNETQSILGWMVSEMAAKYSVPRQIGQEWLARFRLLPLLDGLDEVNPTRRAACVQAINTFAVTTGLSGLVVCSRSDEYTELGKKLYLNNAVCLQSLGPDQIKRYLTTYGEKLSGLQHALKSNPILMEMASSPLTLSIMSMAYQDAPYQTFGQEHADTEEEWRTRLFDAYINRMLSRKVQGRLPYTPEQITTWLSWLARKMVQHGQTVFLIEQLQPSWLETRAQRWKYVIASRIISHMGLNGFMFLSGIFSGAVIGVIDALYFDRQSQEKVIPPPDRYKRLLYILLICSFFILYYSGFYVTFLSVEYLLLLRLGVPPDALQDLITQGFVGFTIITVVALLPALVIGIRGSGQTLQNDIRTIETLTWSWSKALKGSAWFGMGIGLLATMLSVLVGMIVGVRDVPSLVGLACIALPAWGFYVSMYAFPMTGLTSKVSEGKMLPNQGIRMSLRNAFKAGVGVSGGIGAVFGLTSGVLSLILILAAVQTGELPANPGTFLMGFMLVIFMLIMFVSSFILFTSPIIASWYGGFDAIYHYALRYRLEKEGFIPRYYERFLDFAAERIFLRKVGGGYIFVHRLLMEHFASISTPVVGLNFRQQG